MAFEFITESEARRLARAEAHKSGPLAESDILLSRSTLRKSASQQSWDVFMSHSLRDSEIVLGIRKFLEDNGLTVYVDWIDDPHLTRDRVTAATAQRLRARMGETRKMILTLSSNVQQSRWVPWELGYFDARSGGQGIAVLPVKRDGDYEPTKGMEYVDLYPKISRSPSGLGLVEGIGKSLNNWVKG